MKCRDCGQQIKKASKRSDVCEKCFERRGAFLKAVSNKEVSQDWFYKVQEAMQKGNGKASMLIDKAFGKEKSPPEISEDLDDFFNNIEF